MNTLEQRVAALETTNRRYRAGLAASLFALGFVAIAAPRQGVPQQQSYPRQIVADSISVQTVNAYSGQFNQLATSRAAIAYADITDGDAQNLTMKSGRAAAFQAATGVFGSATASLIEVRSPRESGAVRLTGGAVSVIGPEERAVASITEEGGAGIVSVFGKGGFVGFKATADAESGRVAVYNTRGFPLASFDKTDKGDGRVVAHTRNGNKVAMLEVDDTGQFGQAIVRKQGGEPMARLEAGESAGRLVVLDGTKETARFPKD